MNSINSCERFPLSWEKSLTAPHTPLNEPVTLTSTNPDTVKLDTDKGTTAPYHLFIPNLTSPNSTASPHLTSPDTSFQKSSPSCVFFPIPGMASPESITAYLPHPISDLEAMNYYYGLFSKPVLVARTGNDTWIPPTGLESYLRPKELRSVGIHALNEIWEDQLAFQIHDILDLRKVDWTSTDVVRIGFVGESVAPVCVWVGVKPDTLSREEGVIVAQECKQILTTHMILDVEVEIRESVVTRSLGPKMPTPVLSSDPTAGMLEPLTPTLGSSICNTRTPWMEGSGGFYATDNESNLYLVTARHVVFPPDSANNQEYRYKNSSQPRLDVALFGSAAYNRYLEGIKHAINNQSMIINFQERRIKKYSNGTEIEPAAARELAVAERVMKEAQDAYMALTALHNEVKKNWSNISHRVLGYIQFAPPIELQVYPKKYTQDYALIKIDKSKIDTTNFAGNTLDLGTEITQERFTQLMFPNPENNHTFQYPVDRLFRARGIITDSEMRSPTMQDQHGNRCLIVMKRGSTTGLTVGRANTIASYLRQTDCAGESEKSKEWAIYSYDKRSGPFSAHGDSGSVILDCLGRIGGLLTGGDGLSGSLDISYATPVSFILDSLADNGYHVTTEATLLA